MNKFGHINVSKRLSVDLSGSNRFAFLLGSILPDILVHTYIVGHKWETTFDKNCRRLARLENWGRHSFVAYLRLGFILHYIEDYFTFPHNSIYEDNMKQHVKYESDMEKYLKGMEEAPIQSEDIVLSASQLRAWLSKAHKEYIEESVHNCEVDFKYISRAAQVVTESMVAAFARNENKELDLADLGLELSDLGFDMDLEDLELDIDFGLPMNERV